MRKWQYILQKQNREFEKLSLSLYLEKKLKSPRPSYIEELLGFLLGVQLGQPLKALFELEYWNSRFEIKLGKQQRLNHAVVTSIISIAYMTFSHL